jgi:hypothetical protein
VPLPDPAGFPGSDQSAVDAGADEEIGIADRLGQGRPEHPRRDLRGSRCFT